MYGQSSQVTTSPPSVQFTVYLQAASAPPKNVMPIPERQSVTAITVMIEITINITYTYPETLPDISFRCSRFNKESAQKCFLDLMSYILMLQGLPCLWQSISWIIENSYLYYTEQDIRLISSTSSMQIFLQREYMYEYWAFFLLRIFFLWIFIYIPLCFNIFICLIGGF